MTLYYFSFCLYILLGRSDGTGIHLSFSESTAGNKAAPACTSSRNAACLSNALLQGLAAAQESTALSPANMGKTEGCHRWLPLAMGDLPSGESYLGIRELHLLSASTCAARTVAISVPIAASSTFLNRHQIGIIQSWRLSSVWDR